MNIRGDTSTKEFTKTCNAMEVDDALYDEIVNDFIPRWVVQKKKEGWIARVDPDSLLKRSLSGFLGEAVMESFLGVPVLDRDESGRIAVGDSKKFATADLAKGTGLDIGVKSSAAPNFPTPRRNVRRPQVICMRTGIRSFYVGGYASMKTQRSFMMSALVLNDNLRNKRLNNGQLEKAAFFGFHELIQFRSLDELREIYYKHH